LRANGVDSLELPTQNVVLVGAFSRKTHQEKKQVFTTLKFGNLYIDQIFLVSDQLVTPMLIRCNFCIANGLVLGFQKEKLLIKQNDQSVEIDFMSRQKEARGRENSFEALRNQQVVALPTTPVDPCQLAKGEIPYPLKTPPCEVDPCDPEPVMVCMERRKGAFHLKWPPSSKLTLKVIAAVKTAVYRTGQSHTINVILWHATMKAT